MERHFILPATIAATLHVGLLFGVHGRPPAIIGIGAKPEPSKPAIEIVQDPRTPEETPVAQAASSGGESLPDLPELFPPRDSALFTLPRPENTYTRASVDGVMRIEGVGAGPGEAAGVGPYVPPGIPSEALLDNKPRARFQIAPNYPPSARAEGRTGDVTVEFVVDEQGRVHEPRVVNSTDAIFDAAALQAVAKWKFEPGLQNGRVVRFRMAVPLVFRLND